jgi:cephalosporin-C deacetylase-like acetyl esterase
LYWKITLNNIRGTHIEGQLARPVEGGKLPALLIVQWAGVYPLQKNWVTDRAVEGWLVLDIEAHDLPIDESDAFYKDQFSGPLKNYWSIGNDDRDTSYFLRMYLSCYRAADYLAKRKDWDGKTLVVMGGSQGGQQTLMTAGFYPKITAALAVVPAGCDMLGPDIGRKGGWPQWYSNTEGKDPAKVREASRYYDVANFTPRIKCPVLVGMGLIDEVCPAAGVLAAVNQISSPKEVILLPKAGHQDEHNTHGAYIQRCDKASPHRSGNDRGGESYCLLSRSISTSCAGTSTSNICAVLPISFFAHRSRRP